MNELIVVELGFIQSVQAGGSRFGELNLRKQRLTYPMLETLRIETTRTHMSLYKQDEKGDWEVIPRRQSKFYPPPYEFVYLRVQVTNMSSKWSGLWNRSSTDGHGTSAPTGFDSGSLCGAG